MKRILSHTLRQPFIFSTGLAALVHSTWSVSTLFTGTEPYPQFSAAWFAWVLPGFLIAFSLDVGQIVTSAEIRDGSRSLASLPHSAFLPLRPGIFNSCTLLTTCPP